MSVCKPEVNQPLSVPLTPSSEAICYDVEARLTLMGRPRATQEDRVQGQVPFEPPLKAYSIRRCLCLLDALKDVNMSASPVRTHSLRHICQVGVRSQDAVHDTDLVNGLPPTRNSWSRRQKLSAVRVHRSWRCLVPHVDLRLLNISCVLSRLLKRRELCCPRHKLHVCLRWWSAT